MGRTARRAARQARATAPRRAQSGIALVLALWLTVLLTVLASGFAFSMRSEALAARNAVSLAQARAAADGAVERAAYELGRPRVPEAWTADGQARRWYDGNIAIVVTAVDEAAKIDVNVASDTLLKSMLIADAGLDDAAAAALVDAIDDWKDADDLRRPNGAEAPEYRAANLGYVPANAPFETIGEVARVLGMTPAIFQRIAPLVTVYSHQAGVNAATADRAVLLALPNATAETVDAFLQQRANALAGKLTIPPYPPAQAFPSGPVAVWRIRAQATAPDGVTFVREAVLRPSPDPQRPLIALAWLEPSRSAAVPSLASTSPDGSYR